MRPIKLMNYVMNDFEEVGIRVTYTERDVGFETIKRVRFIDILDNKRQIMKRIRLPLPMTRFEKDLALMNGADKLVKRSGSKKKKALKEKR